MFMTKDSYFVNALNDNHLSEVHYYCILRLTLKKCKVPF